MFIVRVAASCFNNTNSNCRLQCELISVQCHRKTTPSDTRTCHTIRMNISFAPIIYFFHLSLFYQCIQSQRITCYYIDTPDSQKEFSKEGFYLSWGVSKRVIVSDVNFVVKQTIFCFNLKNANRQPMWVSVFISDTICVYGFSKIIVAFCAFRDEFVWFKPLQATCIHSAREQEFWLKMGNSFLLMLKNFGYAEQSVCVCEVGCCLKTLKLKSNCLFEFKKMSESKLLKCFDEIVHSTKWSVAVGQFTDATWISIELHFDGSISISAVIKCSSTKTEINRNL